MRRISVVALVVLAALWSSSVPDVSQAHAVTARFHTSPPSSPSAVSTLRRSDVNGDCVVDILDLSLVAASYKAPYPFPHAQADINGDNAIDLQDLVLVATSYSWHCPTHSIMFAPWCSQTDAPGNDDAHLADEFICFQNSDGSAADLTEWHVRDQYGNRYTFPPFTLAGGAYVRLHTGVGNNSNTDLYWGYPYAVWNNSSDVVYLYDQDWLLVERYQYSSLP